MDHTEVNMGKYAVFATVLIIFTVLVLLYFLPHSDYTDCAIGDAARNEEVEERGVIKARIEYLDQRVKNLESLVSAMMKEPGDRPMIDGRYSTIICTRDEILVQKERK